jgi:hydroxypyruvate isomerase
MPLKPSVCIDAVLEKLPLHTAMDLVFQLGYPAIEFWKWWEKDLDAILVACHQLELQVAACCTKFVSLVDPAFRQQYLEGLRQSVAAAQRLNCPMLISQVGDFRPGVSRSEQHDSLVAGLRAALPILENSGVTLAFEPLNELVDHVGYYLVQSDEAFEIVDKVAHPQVKVTFDIYHQQISEGNVIANITNNIDKIAHFHAAGVPGRHELHLGELNYPGIFQAIAASGFDGYVGLEYWPLETPESGLQQVAPWFNKQT